MRLIDADELKETLHETIKDDTRAKYWYDLIGVDDAIDFSPTITFDPPKHGRWKNSEYAGVDYYQCNLCGHAVTMAYNFCPRWGARMDGEICD